MAYDSSERYGGINHIKDSREMSLVVRVGSPASGSRLNRINRRLNGNSDPGITTDQAGR